MFSVAFDNRDNPAELVKQLSGIAGQIPFATSLAINRTAGKVKRSIVEEMKQSFDRPTPYTLRSLFVTPSTKQKLESKVWFKDEYSVGSQGTPATKYLGPEVFGGARGAKAHEKRLRDKGLMPTSMFAVPAQGAEGLLNSYGNINGGLIKQMMSSLQINRDIGYQSNTTAKSRQRNKKRGNYFVVGGASNPLGIMRREANGAMQPVLWFVKQPSYKPRLDFFGVGERTVVQHLPDEMQRAIAYAMRTAK